MDFDLAKSAEDRLRSADEAISDASKYELDHAPCYWALRAADAAIDARKVLRDGKPNAIVRALGILDAVLEND